MPGVGFFGVNNPTEVLAQGLPNKINQMSNERLLKLTTVSQDRTTDCKTMFIFDQTLWVYESEIMSCVGV